MEKQECDGEWLLLRMMGKWAWLDGNGRGYISVAVVWEEKGGRGHRPSASVPVCSECAKTKSSSAFHCPFSSMSLLHQRQSRGVALQGSMEWRPVCASGQGLCSGCCYGDSIKVLAQSGHRFCLFFSRFRFFLVWSDLVSRASLAVAVFWERPGLTLSCSAVREGGRGVCL